MHSADSCLLKFCVRIAPKIYFFSTTILSSGADFVEWSCKWGDHRIEVYYGPFFKGYYELLTEPFCSVCSESNITTEDCSWHNSLYGFGRICAVGCYKPSGRNAEEDLLSYHIWGLKKYRERAQPLGMSMSLTVQNRFKQLLDYDLIVPVPLHSKKIGERGYNQAFELSVVIGSELNIDILEALQKNTYLEMRPMDWTERREAVKGAYAIKRELNNSIAGKSIILVDDVVTTGFTVSECSKLLVDAGASSVHVLAAGRTILENRKSV